MEYSHQRCGWIVFPCFCFIMFNIKKMLPLSQLIRMSVAAELRYKPNLARIERSHIRTRHKHVRSCPTHTLKKKRLRWSVMDGYYHFDFLRSDTTMSHSAKRSELSPKNQVIWLVLLFLLSLHLRSAFISLFFIQFLSFCSLSPLSLFSPFVASTHFPPPLPCLGRHECGRQMAGMFRVSEGSCSSRFPPSSLPARRSARWAEE